MAEPNEKFEIAFLDHVTIRVKDLNVSVDWYEKVLGLRKYQVQEWGIYSIFMLSNKSGVALFPETLSDSEIDPKSKNVQIDHFAFNVTNENFEKAKQWFMELGLDFTFQDHQYFHSIYTKDPDGHTVELTTLVVDSESFYNT